MKPWQTRLNKAPGQGGEEKKRMNKEREDPSPNQKRRNPMWVTMGYLYPLIARGQSSHNCMGFHAMVE